MAAEGQQQSPWSECSTGGCPVGAAGGRSVRRGYPTFFTNLVNLNERLSLPTSRRDAGHRILLHPFVVSDQGETVGEGLCHQHAVERITVQGREVA